MKCAQVMVYYYLLHNALFWETRPGQKSRKDKEGIGALRSGKAKMERWKLKALRWMVYS